MLAFTFIFVGAVAATTCLENNIAYAFRDIKIVEDIQTVEACHDQCVKTDECEYYTWMGGSKECQLKDSSAIQNSYFYKGAMSGPKECCDKISNKGSSFVEVPAETVDECRLLCLAKPGCASSTWRHGALCTLKILLDEPTISSDRCCGADCPAPLMSPCVRAGISYVAPSVEPVTADSLVACAKLCDNKTDCEVFTFHKDGRCRLANMVARDYGMNEANVVSGRKNCGFNVGIEYGGDAYLEITNVEDATACRTECLVRESCKVWVFEDSLCKLRSSLEKWGWGPGKTSGMRFSCFDENIDYPGSDLYPGKPLTWNMYESCQRSCQMDKNCKFFTHSNRTKECWLKNARGSFKRDDDAVSGPKYC